MAKYTRFNSSIVLLALIPLCLALGACGPAAPAGMGAESSQSNQGSQVQIAALADGYVRDGDYASNSYGSANPLEVKTEGPGWNRDAFFKFDASSDGAVDSAVFNFFGSTDTEGASVSADVYAVSDVSWSEAGLTWNGRPALGAKIGSVSVSGASFSKYAVDLSDYVKAERAAGRKVVSFALHSAENSDIVLFVKSREDASYKPSLSMNGGAASPTPVPGQGATPTPPPTQTTGDYPIEIPTSGTHFYVSPSGSDSSNGSKASPWKTINKAVSTARGGSQPVVIHVAAGTYNETVRIPSSYSGTSSARTYLVSDVKWAAKIRGSSDAAVQNKANYFDMVGFDVSGTARIGIHNDPNIGYSRIISNRVHDILATGCSDAGGAGILSDYWSGGKYLDIIGNHIFNIGPASCNTVQGIYFSTRGGLIQNNVVGRVAAWGIHMWHEATDVTISNNTVFNAASGGIVVGAGESSVVASNCKVHNNIVRDTPYGIYEYGQNAASNVYSNNLVFNTPTGIKLQGKSATGTLTGDPHMVDYRADGTGDYHLRSTSIAIDAGVSNSAVPTVDFEGVARPQGKAVDLGAFEWK